MSEVKPLVSVLIRTMDHRRSFLDRALASVQGQQTKSLIEVVVVCDGGNTDRTSEIQKKYQKLSVIYVPTGEKVGRSEAANIAISNSSGKYINFLDDDDILYSSHIEILSDVLNKNESLDAVYAGSDKISVNLLAMDPLTEIEVGASYHYTEIRSTLDIININPFPIQSIMFRSKLINEHRFDVELDALEDWLFWQTILIGKNIYGINISTSRYIVPSSVGEINKRLRTHSDAYNAFKRKSDSIQIPLASIRDAYFEIIRRIDFSFPKKNRDFIMKERLQRAVANPAWAVRRGIKRIRDRLEHGKLKANIKAFSVEQNQKLKSEIDNIFNNSQQLRKTKRRKKNIAIYTSVNSAYLAKAILLGRSIKNYHQEDIDYHILYSDVVNEEIKEFFIKEKSIDVLYPFRLLSIRDIKRWAFQRNVVELCTGVKPFYMKKLLEDGYRYVIYIDPDCRFFSNISPIIDSIDRGSLSLTPHCRTAGISDAQVVINEISALAHGVFNLGYVGIKNNNIGEKVASYWQERVNKYGFDEVNRGLFTDQKFFDFAPIFFKGLDILAHKGVNAASWNLEEAPIRWRDGKYYAGDADLIFFHFSGFDKGVPKLVGSKFGKEGDALHDLLNEYEVDVAKVEREIGLSRSPWALGFFSNGAPIDESHRVCFRTRLDLQRAFEDPYWVSNSDCFWSWVQSKGLEYINSRYDRRRWLPRIY